MALFCLGDLRERTRPGVLISKGLIKIAREPLLFAAEDQICNLSIVQSAIVRDCHRQGRQAQRCDTRHRKRKDPGGGFHDCSSGFLRPVFRPMQPVNARIVKPIGRQP